jgi:putative membrane protein
MTSSLRITTAAILLLTGSSIVGCHTDQSKDMSSNATSNNKAGIYTTDSRILSILHNASEAEIKAGRLAQERGTTDAVRNFGRQLVADHTALDAKVMMRAREAGAALMTPSELERAAGNDPRPPAEDPVAILQGLNGTAFEEAFAQKMYQGHTELISTVEAARPNVQKPKVRQLLDETLPELRKHRDMAKNLQHG